MTELPKRLQKCLARITRCGGVVLIHHGQARALDYTLPNGRSVSPRAIENLRKAGKLESGKDGLFGDDEQTLHVVNA